MKKKRPKQQQQHQQQLLRKLQQSFAPKGDYHNVNLPMHVNQQHIPSHQGMDAIIKSEGGNMTSFAMTNDIGNPTSAGFEPLPNDADSIKTLQNGLADQHTLQMTINIAWDETVGKRPPRDMKRLKQFSWYVVCRTAMWGETPSLYLRSWKDHDDNGFFKPPWNFFTFPFSVGDQIQVLSTGYSDSRNKVARDIAVFTNQKLFFTKPRNDVIPPPIAKSKKIKKSNVSEIVVEVTQDKLSIHQQSSPPVGVIMQDQKVKNLINVNNDDGDESKSKYKKKKLAKTKVNPVIPQNSMIMSKIELPFSQPKVENNRMNIQQQQVQGQFYQNQMMHQQQQQQHHQGINAYQSNPNSYHSASYHHQQQNMNQNYGNAPTYNTTNNEATVARNTSSTANTTTATSSNIHFPGLPSMGSFSIQSPPQDFQNQYTQSRRNSKEYYLKQSNLMRVPSKEHLFPSSSPNLNDPSNLLSCFNPNMFQTAGFPSFSSGQSNTGVNNYNNGNNGNMKNDDSGMVNNNNISALGIGNNDFITQQTLFPTTSWSMGNGNLQSNQYIQGSNTHDNSTSMKGNPSGTNSNTNNVSRIPSFPLISIPAQGYSGLQ